MTLIHLMANYEEWISDDNYMNQLDLVKIFDEAMLEMIKLLNHSKSRFKYQTV